MAKTKQKEYYEAVGRRKESVARVRFYMMDKEKQKTIMGKKISKGDILMNGKDIASFYPRQVDKMRYERPLILTDSVDRYGIAITVSGGGPHSQMQAITHGMARALCVVNEEEYKPLLKQEGFITRDPRKKERRKVGTGGKARRAKQSPKR